MNAVNASTVASGCSSGMKCPASGMTTPVTFSAQGLMEAASEIQASRHIEVRVCFVGGEAQVGGPDLDQLTPNPPPGQRQIGVGTGADHYVHVGRPRRVRVLSEMPVASDRAVRVTPRRARSCFSRGPTWSGAAATAVVVSSTALFRPPIREAATLIAAGGTAPPQLQT